MTDGVELSIDLERTIPKPCDCAHCQGYLMKLARSIRWRIGEAFLWGAADDRVYAINVQVGVTHKRPRGEVRND